MSDSEDTLKADIGPAAEAARRVLDELQKVVVGQREVLEQMLVAFLAGGHALLEGVPGTAKTLMVRALAQIVDLDFKRVQFTPDLMPADIIGVHVFQRDSGRFSLVRGPIFTDLLLGDEINRAPAKTQSALLEAMQEGQATIDGRPFDLPPLFTAFATQNPVEFEGTFPLPEAQLDRFMLKILVEYPSPDRELQILRNYQQGFDANRVATYPVEKVTDREGVLSMRRAFRAVHVEQDVMRYVVEVVRGTRGLGALTLGASPRASVMLLLASRVLAGLRGRDFVIPDDVQQMAPPVLRHRILLTPEAEIEGRVPDDVIRQLLEVTEVPR